MGHQRTNTCLTDIVYMGIIESRISRASRLSILFLGSRYSSRYMFGPCALESHLDMAVSICASERLLEAAIGIEPMNKGFADLCLTTWLRRRTGEHIRLKAER